MTAHSPPAPRICDVAVIGAGPAGMAAATMTAQAGLRAVILDEGDTPGGQIYRDIEHSTPQRKQVLGPDYTAGGELALRLRASDAIYLPRSAVWNISSKRLIEYSRDGASFQLQAGAIVVATGAVERPCPVPGWTKPGVSTVGGLQILLKSSGIVEEAAILAGSGPLLWLVASQMIAAGAPPVAVVETTPPGRLQAALPHLFRALRGHHYLRKGLSLIRAVRRAKVPVFKGATHLEVTGDQEATGLQFISKGQRHRLSARHVALHQGVVPNPQITRLLGCAHYWDNRQYCFKPVTSAHGLTSVEHVYVAGDGAGITGAISADLEGRLAALGIAASMGKPAPEHADRLAAELAADAAIRPFLEALYAPAPDVMSPADAVTICRCEDITAGAIRNAVDLGAPGPNQVKSYLRSGMGPCQGRVCGLLVAAIIAKRRNASMDDTGYFRIRPPLKPLALQELASFEPTQELDP